MKLTEKQVNEILNVADSVITKTPYDERNNIREDIIKVLKEKDLMEQSTLDMANSIYKDTNWAAFLPESGLDKMAEMVSCFKQAIKELEEKL